MRASPPVQPALRRALATPLLGRALGGPLPVSDRGVSLDPATHALLAGVARLGFPRIDQRGVARGRAEMRRQIRLVDVAPLPMHRVDERSIEGPAGQLVVRIYTPRASREPLPGLLFFHGGGFVVGDLETHDSLCRTLAARASAIVVAVDYRLAPEHPFPAATEDAIASYRWLRAAAPSLGIDPQRIAISGDSAGGNLTIVTCLLARDEGLPQPCLQLPIYPATDLTRAMPSHAAFAQGFLLDAETLDWYLANYLAEPGHELDPRGSPLFARDHAGLAPAHVVTAGFDPLRDEGEAYAMALMGAGVPTTVRCEASLIHGFACMGGVVEAARHALSDLAAVLRRHLYA